AATLAAITFAGLWLGASGPRPLPYHFTVESTGPMLFSPNGRWMVKVADGLRVRSLDSARWQLLPGTDSATDPFWSQDSTTIGFFAEGRLHAIALDGSSPQSLAPAPDPR